MRMLGAISYNLSSYYVPSIPLFSPSPNTIIGPILHSLPSQVIPLASVRIVAVCSPFPTVFFCPVCPPFLPSQAIHVASVLTICLPDVAFCELSLNHFHVLMTTSNIVIFLSVLAWHTKDNKTIKATHVEYN